MEPFFCELLSVEVHSPDIGGGVITAAEDGRRSFAVKVGHACEVAFAAVAVAVAPLAVCADCAWRILLYGVNFGSGLAVEYGKIFGTGYDYAGMIVLVFLSVGLCAVIVCHFGIAEKHCFALSVNGTGSCLAYELSLAIAIEVVDHELGVVVA